MREDLECVRRLDISAATHRAVDVPALRHRLLETWRSGHLRQLLTAHPRTKMQLPVHHRDEGAGVSHLWSIQEWEDWLLERLAEAELFYVTHDMTELVAQAAAAKPRYEVHADRLPAEVGFVVFAHPYCTVPPERLAPGQRVELSAALWAPVPDVGGGPEGAAPGVMLVTLQDSDVLLWTQPVGELGPGATPSAVRRVLTGLRHSYGPLSYHEEYPLPFGERPWGMDLAEGLSNEAIGAVMTTWILMGQRITTVEREPMPRHICKQAAREGRPEPTVRTVTLRQARRGAVPVDPQEQRPGEPARRYTKRWPVKDYGYWRDTWYPSKQRHEQQYVWVPGYMKGPEGAPLVGGERVNVLRR